MILRLLDFGIVLFAAAFALAAAIFVYGRHETGSLLSIHAGTQSWQYPLSAQETVSVSGPLGRTTIEIKDHTARIVDSPCKNKLCVMMGAIHNSGQTLACLPNRILVRVTSPSTKSLNLLESADAGVW